jgi:hypothetical protein
MIYWGEVPVVCSLPVPKVYVYLRGSSGPIRLDGVSLTKQRQRLFHFWRLQHCNSRGCGGCYLCVGTTPIIIIRSLFPPPINDIVHIATVCHTKYLRTIINYQVISRSILRELLLLFSYTAYLESGTSASFLPYAAAPTDILSTAYTNFCWYKHALSS